MPSSNAQPLLRGRNSGAGDLTAQGAAVPLAKATPEQRAAIYSQTMGLRITYNPEQASIEVGARPARAPVRVGGPDYANSDWRIPAHGPGAIGRPEAGRVRFL